MPAEIAARHYRTGDTWLVIIDAGQVVRLTPVDAVAPAGPILAPAFFDIQVNGFAGVDFNAPDLEADDLLAATRALARHGVTRYFPTIVTGSPDRMRWDLQTVAAAVDRFPEVHDAVVGVHVEGPYLSDREGARGAHDPQWMRPPDEEHFRRLQEAAGGLIRHVTLAPELDGAADFIKRRTAEDIVVALGHTMAGLQEIEEAVAAGALLSTHLGNGCAAILPRHVNPMTIQLGHDGLQASFIPDGHHLPPYLLKSFIRAKGIERAILTTDCMSAAGAPAGRYRLAGMELEVGEDHVVRLPGQTNFAGSALTLERGVANTVRWAKVPLADAIDMASLHPLRLFGMSSSFIPNVQGDFILVEESPEFTLHTVVRAGGRVV